MNKPFDNPQRTGEARQLVPRIPFSWLAWNDRPYLSSNELLLVPRTRSSQLLKQFATAEKVGGNPHPSSYVTPLVSEFMKPQPTADKLPAYTYLENFFYEAPASSPAPPPTLRSTPNALYRILEYVQTPSLFAGTSTWLNPGNWPGANPGANYGFGSTLVPTVVGAQYDPRLNRQPPFSSISEFRDPGRVNLNTIASQDIWAALFHGNATPAATGNIHPGPSWSTAAANTKSLVDSRRGYGTDGSAGLLLDSTMPTFFGNPFRSADAGDLVPLPKMRRAGVDCTLLRSAGTSSNDNQQNPPAANGDPMFAATTQAVYNDAARSASFRYGPMVRLDNLTTTRSNVYAVWITIGFFEVEPANSTRFNSVHGGLGLNPAQLTALFNRVYPDGYELGREAGIDTGETRRLRGFYIIDRSMPAGFEPGADLNVENTIRLRRRIQ
jgi:hypothetical protein